MHFSPDTRIFTLTKHRAAQNSTYPAQSYNRGPTSYHSAYASPQQTTSHLKSATWDPVSDARDPYKPAPATAQSNFYSPPAQSTYDPYRPSVVSHPSAQPTYDALQHPIQQSHPAHVAHDPYKPVVRTSSPAQSRPTPAYGTLNNYPNAYPKPPVPQVPMPPRVTAESFRTNTSNAYDPPMLPTKPKRHVSGWGSTMTSTHTSSFPPPSPVISNTPLAASPRKDSVPVGPPPRANTSSVGPPPHRVDSPAHQSSVKSPGLPPPPSRPSSRQVLRETGVSHLPPPPRSSGQIPSGPPVQSPQERSYPHHRVDSPGLGTQRNRTASPGPATTSPERFIGGTLPQPQRPPTEGDPEALSNAAGEFPPATDAKASPGLSWDPEGGPTPSTARQSDYVAPKDDGVGDVTIREKPRIEQGPTASSHSRVAHTIGCIGTTS